MLSIVLTGALLCAHAVPATAFSPDALQPYSIFSDLPDVFPAQVGLYTALGLAADRDGLLDDALRYYRLAQTLLDNFAAQGALNVNALRYVENYRARLDVLEERIVREGEWFRSGQSSALLGDGVVQTAFEEAVRYYYEGQQEALDAFRSGDQPAYEAALQKIEYAEGAIATRQDEWEGGLARAVAKVKITPGNIPLFLIGTPREFNKLRISAFPARHREVLSQLAPVIASLVEEAGEERERLASTLEHLATPMRLSVMMRNFLRTYPEKLGDEKRFRELVYLIEGIKEGSLSGLYTPGLTFVDVDTDTMRGVPDFLAVAAHEWIHFLARTKYLPTPAGDEILPWAVWTIIKLHMVGMPADEAEAVQLLIKRGQEAAQEGQVYVMGIELEQEVIRVMADHPGAFRLKDPAQAAARFQIPMKPEVRYQRNRYMGVVLGAYFFQKGQTDSVKTFLFLRDFARRILAPEMGVPSQEDARRVRERILEDVLDGVARRAAGDWYRELRFEKAENVPAMHPLPSRWRARWADRNLVLGYPVEELLILDRLLIKGAARIAIIQTRISHTDLLDPELSLDPDFMAFFTVTEIPRIRSYARRHHPEWLESMDGYLNHLVGRSNLHHGVALAFDQERISRALSPRRQFAWGALAALFHQDRRLDPRVTDEDVRATLIAKGSMISKAVESSLRGETSVYIRVLGGIWRFVQKLPGTGFEGQVSADDVADKIFEESDEQSAVTPFSVSSASFLTGRAQPASTVSTHPVGDGVLVVEENALTGNPFLAQSLLMASSLWEEAGPLRLVILRSDTFSTDISQMGLFLNSPDVHIFNVSGDGLSRSAYIRTLFDRIETSFDRPIAMVIGRRTLVQAVQSLFPRVHAIAQSLGSAQPDAVYLHSVARNWLRLLSENA